MQKVNPPADGRPPESVLVIGAGPAGLFASAELARHGIAARLIERDPVLHREARATSVQPGTLEILESVGLLAPFLDAAEHVRGSRVYGPDMAELRAMRFDGVDCRCQFQCSLPQYEIQRILEAHLLSLGGAVERGVTATAVAAGTDGVRVELVHATGRRETVQADIVVDAGGAHSVTRQSMDDPLEGSPYEGHFLVADVAMPALLPRDEASVVCSSEGMLLLAPLPGGRWISFQDLEAEVQRVSAADVIDRIEARLDGRCRPTDVAWSAPFRMHRRIVSRLADGQRFLIGDAAHLSSPFGGEGLNSALHDGYDLAWKLALVMHGHARRSLLDDYAIERAAADRHVLEISDRMHRAIMGLAEAVRERRDIPVAIADPVAAALLRNARAMIDVDYAGSPLVADCVPSGSGAEPHPGQRYPDWTRLGGMSHRVLVFGPVADTESLARLPSRWARHVDIARDPDLDPARAGVPAGGCVLIRPDGHIGFRCVATDAAAIAALDRHLSSYLIPYGGNGRAGSTS